MRSSFHQRDKWGDVWVCVFSVSLGDHSFSGMDSSFACILAANDSQLKLNLILDCDSSLIDRWNFRLQLPRLSDSPSMDCHLFPSYCFVELQGLLIVVCRDEPEFFAAGTACSRFGSFEKRPPHRGGILHKTLKLPSIKLEIRLHELRFYLRGSYLHVF
jgi:hypothetical protein